ncbi:4-hydroxybenzoate octaprenyltransferase [Planktotalea sp.]|uniref:4-hydroxybenzoate octaprenyltransferase n=1 Tax=Planktotalea sp. TaxID=2029877 RepID=UPI0025E40A59|nr:4-hydroxybenzoate octaprenyltransferase [Planktotalea sp.]
MQGASQEPEGDVTIADAVKDNWVDTTAPNWLRPYLRLSRFDRSIGTWLLLLPCWWALMLAMLWSGNACWFDAWIFIGCAIGATLMRGAGCTWNDITDRNYDGAVERTRNRPIPSGQVTVRQALIWMALQTIISLGVLLTFNWAAIGLGVLSLLPVLVYPFAKRFTWWPQVFLGLAFNWGALLAWTAHSGSLGWPALTLYAAGIAWTLFYDTIYAHQDTEDDALIGIKSTARLFGAATPQWLLYFLIASLTLFCFAVVQSVAAHSPFALILTLCGTWAFGWHLHWQLRHFNPTDQKGLITLFRSNRDAGLLPVLFFAIALML